MNAQIQIMYIIGSLDFGGTERQLYLLLKNVNRSIFKPCVVSLSIGGYWVPLIRQLGIEVIELERHRNYEIKRLLALVSLIKKRMPNILHTFQPPGNVYGWLAGFLTGKGKCIVSCRSFEKNGRAAYSLNRILNRMIYRTADAVVSNSKSLYEDLKIQYGKKINGMVIYNGIEINNAKHDDCNHRTPLKRKLGLPEDALVVGTIGRMIPIKNHRLFLDIAAEILTKTAHVYFLIIGNGPLEGELRSYASRISISERVIFTGFRDDVQQLLDIFDVFLFTSSNLESKGEGLPNAVMEAMSCGVPCIASNAGGTSELFIDGEAGYLVDPHVKEGYVEKTLSLLENRILREKLGRKGAALIQKNYSFNQMVLNFENLYSSLMGSTHHLNVRGEINEISSIKHHRMS